MKTLKYVKTIIEKKEQEMSFSFIEKQIQMTSP